MRGMIEEEYLGFVEERTVKSENALSFGENDPIGRQGLVAGLCGTTVIVLGAPHISLMMTTTTGVARTRKPLLLLALGGLSIYLPSFSFFFSSSLSFSLFKGGRSLSRPPCK